MDPVDSNLNKDNSKDSVSTSDSNQDKIPLAAFVANVAQQQVAKEREKMEAALTEKIEKQLLAKYAHLMKDGSEDPGAAPKLATGKRGHASVSSSLRDKNTSSKKLRLETTSLQNSKNGEQPTGQHGMAEVQQKVSLIYLKTKINITRIRKNMITRTMTRLVCPMRECMRNCSNS